MDKHTWGRIEKTAVAGSVVGALGSAAYYIARKRAVVPRPEILNDDRLSDSRRWMINRTAAHILFSYRPSRGSMIATLQASRDHVSNAINYLSDNGLVFHQPAMKSLEMPAHYVATMALAETLQQPEQYPLLEAARLERIERQRANGNS